MCKELSIKDVNETNKGKEEFKEEATKACLSWMIMEDVFGKKEYFTKHIISQARMYFAGNCSHDQSLWGKGGKMGLHLYF